MREHGVPVRNAQLYFKSFTFIGSRRRRLFYTKEGWARSIKERSFKTIRFPHPGQRTMSLSLSSHALLTKPYEPYVYPPCANMNTTADLGLGCPSGGNFYTCQGNALQFIGCCTSNPCASNGVCPDTYLRPASFNASLYDKISQQACAESTARWYSYSELPTFLGCCLSDPCKQGGCPIRDLRPARLSDKTEAFFNKTYYTI